MLLDVQNFTKIIHVFMHTGRQRPQVDFVYSKKTQYHLGQRQSILALTRVSTFIILYAFFFF